MKSSESIKNIAKALVDFQSEVKDPRKEANNPFFKSKYVTLDALVDCVRPVLSKHGLAYIQSPSGDGQNISVTTLLIHESGEWIESDAFVMKAAKADPQGAGSAVTYGRRYSLQAVLGVTWCDEDDDGNACTFTKSAPVEKTIEKAESGNKASAKQIGFIRKLGKNMPQEEYDDVLFKHGVDDDSLANLTGVAASQVINELMKKGK